MFSSFVWIFIFICKKNFKCAKNPGSKVIFNLPSMQGSQQNECWHGSNFGLRYLSKQMQHVKSCSNCSMLVTGHRMENMYIELILNFHFMFAVSRDDSQLETVEDVNEISSDSILHIFTWIFSFFTYDTAHNTNKLIKKMREREVLSFLVRRNF